MVSSISGRISMILLGFAVLLAASAIASRFVLQRQVSDALVVNLAGRQRMLTQKMSKESAELVLLHMAPAVNEAKVASLRDELQTTVRIFEMTLFALRDGGAAPQNLELTRVRELPAATNHEVRASLDRVVGIWQPFKGNVQALLRSSGADQNAMRAVFDDNGSLLEQMNSAVSAMQKDCEARVAQLFWVQAALLAVGFLLVFSGVWVTRSSIARPLRELSNAARSMSTGNLSIELYPRGAREVRELSASFDRMRVSMLAALSGPLRAGGIDDDL